MGKFTVMLDITRAAIEKIDTGAIRIPVALWLNDGVYAVRSSRLLFCHSITVSKSCQIMPYFFHVLRIVFLFLYYLSENCRVKVSPHSQSSCEVNKFLPTIVRMFLNHINAETEPLVPLSPERKASRKCFDFRILEGRVQDQGFDI